MESLEETLKRIGKLSIDLYAEIVIQEAEEGIERVQVGSSGGPCSFDKSYDFEDRYVEYKPRIAIPDTEKRGRAYEALQKMYEFSEEDVERYAAGIALGIKAQELDKQIMPYIDKLLDKKRQEDRGFRNLYDLTKTKELKEKILSLLSIKDLQENYRNERERETRESISKLLGMDHVSFLTDELLFPMHKLGWRMLDKDELKTVYDNSKSHDVRVRAGKQLGYSGFKIWKDEHPAAAITAGIAAIGAASGLIYALAEYFSK
jgi:hypothetical protein